MSNEPTASQQAAAAKAKKILFGACCVASMLIAVSFTRTSMDLAVRWVADNELSTKDIFNLIPFKKGYWAAPALQALSGAGLQKIFSQMIIFRPSVEQDIYLSRMEFDMAMTVIKHKFVVAGAYDEFFVICFDVRDDRGTGFRLSANPSIPSGWVRFEGNRFTLMKSVPLVIPQGRSVRIRVTFNEASTTVKVGNESFTHPGDAGGGGLGFFLGFLYTDIRNLVITHSEGTYRDLFRKDSPSTPKYIFLVIFFLLPLANWLLYSYVVHLAFDVDFIAAALRDFPLTFLFLFFKVNPHASVIYGIIFFLVVMATVRGLVLASIISRSGRSVSFRLKGLAIYGAAAATAAISLYMLSAAFAYVLKPGEAFMNRPALAGILFVILYTIAAAAFFFREKSNQAMRLAAAGAFFVFLSYVPAYWSPSSRFVMSDKLFKPSAMYHDYHGMAKTKKIANLLPGHKRIYVLGGSAAYGFPMDVTGKAFSRHLEGNLRKRGIKADVLNLGMMGHTISTLRYSMKRNRIFNLYPADMVILYLGYNGATYFPRIYGMPDKTDWQSIRYINDASTPAKMARLVAFSRPVSYLLLVKSMFTEPAVAPVRTQTYEQFDRGVAVPRVNPDEVREHLRWFKRQCDDKKARLIVVPVLINRLRTLSELSSQNAQVRALIDESNRMGIPVIDCYPEFDSINNFYMFDPVHLTPEGHRRVGEILAPKVASFLR